MTTPTFKLFCFIRKTLLVNSDTDPRMSLVTIYSCGSRQRIRHRGEDIIKLCTFT